MLLELNPGNTEKNTLELFLSYRSTDVKLLSVPFVDSSKFRIINRGLRLHDFEKPSTKYQHDCEKTLCMIKRSKIKTNHCDKSVVGFFFGKIF